MKTNYFILFFLCSNFIFSQNILVKYNVKINANAEIKSTSINYTLIKDKNESLFFNGNDSIKQFKYKDFVEDTFKAGDITLVKLDDSHYGYIKKDAFYKNHLKNELIYNEIISTKKIILKERINLFKWKIIPNSNKTILGFKCQKATTFFRGRTYEAYFSSEIATNGGPWKFDGLPGLIISIKSTDNYFVIQPLKIILNGKNEFLNPYKKTTTYSWQDFRNKYISFFKKQIKRFKSKSEPGESGSIKITDRIEDLKIPEMKY